MGDDWEDWGDTSSSNSHNNQGSSNQNTGNNGDWPSWDGAESSSDRMDNGAAVGRGKRASSFRDGGGGWNSREPQGPSSDWGSSSGPKSDSLNGNCLTIYIPTTYVARVIGRQGSTIKEFQTQSGARIKVHNDSVNGESQIDIMGEEHQRDVAKGLINKVTGVSNDNRPTKQLKTSEPEPMEFDWGAAIKESDEATRQKWASLAPLKKEFYREDPSIAAMSSDEVRKFREDNNNIMVSHFKKEDTRALPNPVLNFKQAFVDFPDILREIEKNGFVTPSPIQSQSWPILLQGIDLIGIAQTGTGKTLAYLLPAMIHIENQIQPRNERPGPTALVLAPTRELAQQIEKESKKYSYRGIRSVCIYGGGDRRAQVEVVNSGIEIVIATPGRLNDLCMSRELDLSSVSYLVLDEADRMLDMGFEPQIKKVMLDIRPDRQTVMMSATWPSGVQKLANTYMNDPFQINVGTLDLDAVHSVTQKVVIIDQNDKRKRLDEFFASMQPNDKVIVFVGRKTM